MKQVWRAGSVVVVALSLAVGAGCEWSGPESDSINTSQGAGIDVNYSGVYDGLLSGGKAVSAWRSVFRRRARRLCTSA